MTRPFKEEDKVHHPIHGECVVMDVETYPDQTKVKVKGGHWFWTPNILLSFKPWPAPCHERPIEDGWWICSGLRSNDPYVRLVQDGKVVYYGRAYSLSQYNFHKYIGKDWK